MGAPDKIVFDYKEITELLIKKENIHEGIWALNLDFGLKGANMGPSDEQLVPVAMVAILKIGLQRVDTETNLSVNASKVNPPPNPLTGKRKIRTLKDNP